MSPLSWLKKSKVIAQTAGETGAVQPIVMPRHSDGSSEGAMKSRGEVETLCELCELREFCARVYFIHVISFAVLVRIVSRSAFYKNFVKC